MALLLGIMYGIITVIGGCDMDLFRFLNPTAPTKFEQGVIINGLTSAIWIERYREAGEFTLKARVDSDLRRLLPVGTFISHVDTKEIMVVENLEVNNDQDLSSEITFTGRSFETLLEQRVVGTNKTFPRDASSELYGIYFGPIGEQAVTLIEDHILAENLIDDNDALPYVSVLSTVPEDVFNIAVSFNKDQVYSQLIELLSQQNIGIKTIRPNGLSPLGPSSPNAALLIYQGVDRSSTVILSNDLGDIAEADYFWSNKKFKNTALVTSTWFEIMIKASAGIGRRVMYVDGSDLDENYEEAPTGALRDDVIDRMTMLGEKALAKQKEIVITNVETSRNFGKYVYGVDFDLGDIITVVGGYHESTKVQVVEYVKIEDETGRFEYPTLAVV
jgi:hypothetical protein